MRRVFGVFVLLCSSSLLGAAEPDPLPAGAVSRLGSSRLRHPGLSINALAFSPDGKQVVTAGHGSALVFWDAESGREARRLEVSDEVYRSGTRTDIAREADGCAWSADGKLFAAGGMGLVQVWDAAGWKELKRFRIDGRPDSIAFTEGNKGLVVIDLRGKQPHAICHFDLATGRETERLLVKKQVHGQLSPGGRYLAVRDFATVRLIRTDTGDEVNAFFVPNSGSDTGITTTLPAGFTPDGKKLALVKGDTFVLWDLDEDREAASFKVGYPRGPQLAILSGDGKRVLTIGSTAVPARPRLAPPPEAGVLQIHDTARGELLHKADMPLSRRENARGSRGATSPGGALIAWGQGNSVEMWDVAAGKRLDISSEGPTAPTRIVRFSGDGKRVVTFSPDEKVVRLWETATGKLLTTLNARVQCVALSDDGKLLATGSDGGKGGTVQLWDADGKEVAKLPDFHFSSVEFVGFADGGRKLVSTDSRGISATWDVEARTKLHDIPGGGQRVKAITADGQTALVSTGGFTMGLQNLKTGFAAKGKLAPLGAGEDATLSPDGRLFVGASHERDYAYVWDVEKGSWVLPAIPVRLAGGRLGLSADGKLLAVANTTKPIVWLWELPSGKLKGVINTGQPGVTALALSADGERLAVAGRDSSLLIWDATKVTPAPRPEVVERSSTELDRLWLDLGDFNTQKQFVAMWALVESGPAAVTLLRDRVKQGFVDRQRAERVAEVLEFLGTEEATKLLKELTENKSVDLQKAAKAALERLEKRNP